MDWSKITEGQLLAATLLVSVTALGGIPLVRLIRAARAKNGEASGHDHERRERSCGVLEERAGGIEVRVSVVEAGLVAVREDVAAIRSEAGDRHGEVMRAIGSITGEIRALRARE